LRASPQDTITYLFLGKVYDARGRPEKAILAWRQAKAAHFFLHQAGIRQRGGDSVGAIEKYRPARQIDPSVVPPTEIGVTIAWAHYYEGFKEEAEDILLGVVQNSLLHNEATGLQTLALGELGTYYLREGRWTDAVETYHRALAIEPLAFEYRLWLGKAYRKQGLLEDAKIQLLQATQAQGTNVRAYAFVELAETYKLLGEWDDAINAYREAVALRPDEIEHHLRLVQALVDTNRVGEALEEYQIILSLKPDDEELRNRYEGLRERSSK
jgi:tetratricopeptide (TPR) repeat protein